MAHNSICETSKTPREGFELVESKDRDGNPTFKYFHFYDRVEALVKKIEFSEREWQGKVFRSWRLSLDAAGKPCVLELPLDSRVGNRFMKLAENIDYSRPVEFAAWQDRVTGNTAFMVGQREHEEDEKAVSVPQKYTQANPGDCPEPKKRMGGKKWDWGDQEDFLYEQMINVVIPRVEAAQEILGGHSDDADPEYAGPAESLDDGSDVPF